MYHAVLLALIFGYIAGCKEHVEQGSESDELPVGSSRLSELLSDGGVEGYSRVTEPRRFSFPEDHGPHPDYRNEWWYVTGNLDGRDGERFGFELTFFRFSLGPRFPGAVESAWRTNQVYIAHFTISDVGSDQFDVAQRFSRGAAGLAGATAHPFRVWVDDWMLRDNPSGQGWQLRARADGFGLELALVAEKQPVLNGENGLSQKSDEPGNASYYYSISRLQSDGTLNIDEHSYIVSGEAWLDREWSSSALSKDQLGWDWFALQLSDGSELMFYQLRRNDGSIDIHSSGTRIDAGGSALQLTKNDVSISVTNYWESKSGGRYPAGWKIHIPTMDMTLLVSAAMSNQELITNVRYWEGAVDVTGVSGGQPLSGRGYVELTGYAEN